MKNKHTYLVFLGAGASTPLDFPGSIQLVKDFVKFLKYSKEQSKNSMLRKISEIKVSIESNNLDYDSESLYSCLQGYSNPCYSIKQAGPYACSACGMQPVSRMKADPICIKLRSLFEEFIIKNYYKGDLPLNFKIMQMYNRLFSKVSGKRNWKKSKPNWTFSTFEIFTTNYDNVLETYSELVNKDIFNGYDVLVGNRAVFVPERYETNSSPLKLYKLHGSVELSVLETGEMVSNLPPAIPGQMRNGKKILSKVMIYGIEKNLIAEPFFDLLAIFKKRLSQVKKCLIIGYSFRDSWINQIFIDVIKKNPGSIEIEIVGKKDPPFVRNIPSHHMSVTRVSKSIQKYLNLPTMGGIR